MTWHTIITYMPPPHPHTHTNKLRPAGFLAQRLNKNVIYGEVHQTHKPFFQTSCTNLQLCQITHKKREINSHRYDAMLSLEGCVCRWWWWGVFGDYRPNWQQAEDAASFRRCNLASVIADTINGGPRGAAGGAETEV